MIVQEFIDDLLDFIRVNNPSKDTLVSEKKALAKKYGMNHIPSDIQILTHLDDNQLQEFKEHLLTKPMRTNSGVTVVAVMTKPLRCPHGKCTYCPGGPGSAYGDVPQSYTGHEPATMRGIRAGYDAYIQVFGRLEQYIVSGHNPEKVELILMGGTLPSYDILYQDEVIRDVFKAMNDFSTEFYSNGLLQFEKFKEFFELPGTIGDEKREAKIHKKIRELKAKNYDTVSD